MPDVERSWRIFVAGATSGAGHGISVPWLSPRVTRSPRTTRNAPRASPRNCREGGARNRWLVERFASRNELPDPGPPTTCWAAAQRAGTRPFHRAKQHQHDRAVRGAVKTEADPARPAAVLCGDAEPLAAIKQTVAADRAERGHRRGIVLARYCNFYGPCKTSTPWAGTPCGSGNTGDRVGPGSWSFIEGHRTPRAANRFAPRAGHASEPGGSYNVVDSDPPPPGAGREWLPVPGQGPGHAKPAAAGCPPGRAAAWPGVRRGPQMTSRARGRRTRRRRGTPLGTGGTRAGGREFRVWGPAE